MWIDIKEQEPEHLQKVLIYPYDKTRPTIEAAKFDTHDKVFFNCYDDDELDVDFWMRLPEPPSIEVEDENLQIVFRIL